MKEDWLNGWYRDGHTVLVGTNVRCAGCGRDEGVTCVAFAADYVAPDRLPDWPFMEDGCPLCQLRDKLMAASPADRLAERAVRYKRAAKERG